MKRYGILALALVLCCGLFTGCRRSNPNRETVSPTNEATTAMPTMPTVLPETHPATEPASAAPTEHESSNAATDATEDTTGQQRSRAVPKSPAMR